MTAWRPLQALDSNAYAPRRAGRVFQTAPPNARRFSNCIAIAVIGGIVMTMQFKKLTFTSDPSKKETAETAEPDAEPATS